MALIIIKVGNLEDVILLCNSLIFFPPKSHNSRMNSWDEIYSKSMQENAVCKEFPGLCSPPPPSRKTSMLFSPLMPKSGDVSLQFLRQTVIVSFQFSGLSVVQQKIQSVLR